MSFKIPDIKLQTEVAAAGLMLFGSARDDGYLYDVDNPGRRLLHVHHRLAVLRRTSNCSAWKVLRSVHGRRRL